MKFQLAKADARSSSSVYTAFLALVVMLAVAVSRYMANIMSLGYRRSSGRVKVIKNLLVRASGGFDSKSLENLSVGIIFIIVLLAVGGFIVTDLFTTLGSYTPTVAQSNPLYNATTNVVHGMQSLGSLFSSAVGLITILIIIAIVSVVIALLRNSFTSGGGTGS